jgi:hypothetical protein
MADRRASKSSAADRTSRTTTAGPHSRLTARWRVSGSNRSGGASKLTTWPQACTPVSVRPAQISSTGARSTFSSASRSVPPTVGTPGLGAKPWNPVPS